MTGNAFIGSCLVVVGVLAAAAHSQTATSHLISYEGKLTSSGWAVTESTQLRFALFTDASAGQQVGSTVQVAVTPDANGRFAVDLPFGPEHFQATSRWLQIYVQDAAGEFTPLLPRQACTSAGLAKRAVSANAADMADNVVHAISANSVGFIANVPIAVTADQVPEAGHASGADAAGQTDTVPHAGITGNPWTLSGTLLQTSRSLGIGKTPVERVDVIGNTRLNDQNIYLRSNADVNHLLGWYGGTKTFDGVAPDGPVLTGFLGGILGTTGQSVVHWNSSGQVGIGVFDTQGAVLAVNGNAAIPGGGFWSTLSDPRTKQGIRPLTGILDRLLSLRGYEYEYLPQYVEQGQALPGTQIGLLATEVKAVFPDWVETGSDGLMRVTERATTALLVEALRDLEREKQREIDALLSRIEALEAEQPARTP